MINKFLTFITPQEALALIGAGLFVFGVWKIYPPSAFILAGCLLMLPMAAAMRVK